MVVTYMFPLVKVGQVDPSSAIDVAACLEHHATGGLHKHHRWVVRMGVH